MEFVDIDEEVWRLQKEGDLGFDQAIVIATLADSYSDLKLFRDCWGNLKHCSASVNAKVELMEMDSCHKCDGLPLKVWPYLVIGKAGERLYSDPPCFTVADQNREGFGEIPRDGWLEEMQALGIGESVIRKVSWHLKAHPPIDYFGDDDEPKGAEGPADAVAGPNQVPAKPGSA